MRGTRLEVPNAAERDDLATVVGRAVQLDPSVVVRLRADPADGRVELFAATPFDALVTRTATGTVVPADLTVTGAELLAALAVAGGASVDPGVAVDERWRGPVPAGTSWTTVGAVGADELDGAARRATAAAQSSGRFTAAVLDETAVTVEGLWVPMRCLLALSGAGLLDGGGEVRVATGDGWLRLEAAGGAVVRRRLNPLALHAL